MAETKKSAWGYVAVWAVLAVLTVATWVLGKKVQLGTYSLPVAMLIAITKTALVAMFFMHLVEQPGAMRVVLPVSAVFLFLLMGIVLLEAGTREMMARPDGFKRELEPKRPTSTRTSSPGSDADSHRWMGN